MKSEHKQRISLYLDKELVKEADKFIKEQGLSSRNDLFSKAVERLMADEILRESPAVSERLAQALADVSEDNAKAISKGLFRYAVQLEMMMQMLATQFDCTQEQIGEMRREAINNVRRTRGKVKLDDIIAGYYQD